MTAVTATTAAPAVRSAGFGRLVQSEWTKIRSVRSTGWSLALLAVLFPGLMPVFVGMAVSDWEHMNPVDRAAIVADPAGFMLGSGFLTSQPVICVLGVLVIASEYSTGMIRSSLLAVPRRLPMLAAKSVVFFVVVFVVSVVASFVAFSIGAAMLQEKVPVSLGDPGVLRAVIGGGLYLALLGVFSLAIGALVRHTAAGISIVIGFVLVLAPLAATLPGKAGDYIHAYLPTEAGLLIGQAKQGANDLLTPWQGFGVFVLWTAVLMIIAAVLLKRRDA
ncbi:ABC transporter permease [Kibdelosporangium aridum]|uniref:ABC transporter permease n=1 Tax=Kibdelosporangium aridum TaxID=2030 RepID=A0A428Z4X3_KIBAR|nr:ABC transporter permease [Kibdelosporangium aridum]RSM81643.1 ABC transporter permease [Kibdelosporangium aridum]